MGLRVWDSVSSFLHKVEHEGHRAWVLHIEGVSRHSERHFLLFTSSPQRDIPRRRVVLG